VIFYLAIALFAGLVVYVITHRNAPWDMNHSTVGGIGLYFEKITDLEPRFESCFITAVASDDTRFVQISVGTDDAGVKNYQFDIPVTDWSRDFAQKIEAEAERRSLEVIRIDGTNNMQFLDVNFPDRAQHDSFVIWVIEDVFRLPKTETYEITWGEH
jgi:hypothetical protein